MADSLDMTWFERQEKESKIFRKVRTCLPDSISLFLVVTENDSIIDQKNADVEIDDGVLSLEHVMADINELAGEGYCLIRTPILYCYDSSIRDLVDGSQPTTGDFYSLDEDFEFNQGVAGLHEVSLIVAVVAKTNEGATSTKDDDIDEIEDYTLAEKQDEGSGQAKDESSPSAEKADASGDTQGLEGGNDDTLGQEASPVDDETPGREESPTVNEVDDDNTTRAEMGEESEDHSDLDPKREKARAGTRRKRIIQSSRATRKLIR